MIFGSSLRTPTLFLLVCLGLPAEVRAQLQPRLNLMPMPAQLELRTGQFVISQSFSVAITGNDGPTVERAVQRFVRNLSGVTGMPMKMTVSAPTTATLVIHADRERKPILEPGDDESYELNVSKSAANLTAPSSLGILYGLQTFIQLV